MCALFALANIQLAHISPMCASAFILLKFESWKPAAALSEFCGNGTWYAVFYKAIMHACISTDGLRAPVFE